MPGTIRRYVLTGILGLAIVPSVLGGQRAVPIAEPAPLRWGPCGPGQVQVLLVGTFHMADADALADVLPPRRQVELDELVRRIARFAPTKVAVERPSSTADTLNVEYRAFVAGSPATLTSRSEVRQLGFRLARLLRHDRIHPVDYRMNLGSDSLSAFYRRHPDALARVQASNAANDTRDSIATSAIRERTLTEIFLWMSERAHLENASFFRDLLPLGEGGNYAGAETLARWYDRNLRIVQNLIRITEPGDQRIALVIGNGHIRPLKHLLEETPSFCPVSVGDFLR